MAAHESVFAKYEPVIGLEVHCQLKTTTKLFCACTNSFGSLPNRHTCEICSAQPGCLPVLNNKVVDYAVRFALAVDAEISSVSEFSRKQYFYPDLPKGYQITQFDRPYALGGSVLLEEGTRIALTRTHIEEDAGKNIHGDHASFVDLNRAGVPLIEIVTTPTIRTAAEAASYLRSLRSLVRYLDICDGNLEEGSFRCDANISVRRKGEEKLGTRCEVKNLNSFRNIEKAIEYETLRQITVIESGGKVQQQTMLFDPATGRTKTLRSKEEALDYRYFPEPDLRPPILTSERIQKIRESLPELPEAKKQRFLQDYGITEYDADVLTREKELAQFYEEVIQNVRKLCGDKASPKIIANWVLSEYLREMNARGWAFENLPISAEMFAGLIVLLLQETISGKLAKQVFEEMVENPRPAEEITREKGWVQVSDTEQIKTMITEVLQSFPEQIAEYKSGKTRMFGFFVGQIMKKSQGKFNPGIVNDLLKKSLDG